MTDKEANAIMARALKHYGVQNQIKKTFEECAELIDAVLKWEDGRATEDQVISEAVDVYIMVSQMIMAFGLTKGLAEMTRKLQRLEARIEANERRD